MTHDPTTMVAPNGLSPPVDVGVDGELAALRAKAGRICDGLADLYRRMDLLQRQIEAHQDR
jgi:hypothetical protein